MPTQLLRTPFLIFVRLSLLLLCFTAQAAPTKPIALPPGVERGPELGGISEYRLANGLKVLLLPDQARDKILVNVTYLVGSRHEGYGESGMAHLLEHMLFKGTPRFPDAKAELMKFGSTPNGSTYYDRTNYFETFSASETMLGQVLVFEADRMINAKVAKADLDAEMTVVRSEFERGENSPQNLLDNRVLAAAYMWHNYGRDVIGSREDIENVPIDRLRDFYKRYYQPDNAVVVIAGRFDPARALQLVHKAFGSIPKPKRVLFDTYTREPAQDGERVVVLRRVGKVQLVEAAYHIPPGSHPDYVAMDVLTEILGMQPNGRLHTRLVESKQAATISGSNMQLRDAGVLRLFAEVPPDQSLEQARDTLLATAEGFAAEPVTEQEMQRARAKLTKEIDLYLPDTFKVAQGMSEFIGIGDWRLLFYYRDRLSSVTLEDVQRVATAYLRPANRTLGLFYPTAESQMVAVPDTPDVGQLLRDFKPTTDLAMGESFDPTPQNIEARIIRRTLPSGMKLHMLPKKTRGGTVVAAIGLHWGDELSKQGKRAACNITNVMLSRGTELRTRSQLRDELDRLRATVAVGTENATVSTLRDSFPDALRLAAEMLRKPSFPVSEFEQVKRELSTALEAQRDDPAYLGSTRLARHLNPYPPEHWNYTPTIEESIARSQAVTLEDMRACHAMMNASNSEMVVVGDFDPEQVAKLAMELFGDWQSSARYERIPARHDDVPALKELIRTPDKANAELEAGLNIPMRDDDPDFAAMVIGTYLLGGNWESRLWQRIREKEGLSYSVGSWFEAADQDAAALLGAQAIYAPQNRERVEKAVREELRRVLDQGYTDAEVQKARTTYIQARALSRNSDTQLLGRLLKYAYIGRDFKWDIEFERRIAALTPKEIRTAMRKHVDAEKLSIVEAGDFK